MNGVPNNTATVDFDNNDAKDFVGRLFLTPFKPTKIDWLSGLGFGVAGTFGNESNSSISTYKTWGQSTWFSYNSGVTAAGQHARLGTQGYYYFHQLGLMAEYSQDHQSLNLTSKSVNRTDAFTNTGYFLRASYYLTGENASYGAVSPIRPFQLGEEGGLEPGSLRLASATSRTIPGSFNLGLQIPVSPRSHYDNRPPVPLDDEIGNGYRSIGGWRSRQNLSTKPLDRGSAPDVLFAGAFDPERPHPGGERGGIHAHQFRGTTRA